MERDDVLEGRFRVEGPLRQGGMGRLWIARDLQTGDLVVVKMLQGSWGEGSLSSTERLRYRGTLLKRFERECNLLERLEHRGIPRLLGRGFEGVDPYMVMEYIDGAALDEFLKRNTLTPDAATAIMTQLLDALAYAHREGVVHRDVKPHNVIVGTDHVVHLIDFGIAYLTDPDATRYTEEGATPGSLGYKAPELIGAGGGDVTPAADVYGAGCVYYMLLTGKRPFEGTPERSIEDQHRHEEAPRARATVDHIAPAIDDVIARMLAKAPGDRPAAEEVVEVLRPYLPRPGDPAPNPRLVPDPTLPYRAPDGRERPGEPERPPRRGRSRRSARPGVDRPTRAEYDRLVAEADEEIEAGEPGPAIARLENTLAEVRRAWGLGYLPIARACLRCGDAARLEGICFRARARYRDAERQVAGDGSAEGAELLAEARIGLAECLVPEGRVEEAVVQWLAIAQRVAALDPVPARLVRRLHEVALELIEHGHESRVRPMLDRLPSDPGEWHRIPDGDGRGRGTAVRSRGVGPGQWMGNRPAASSSPRVFRNAVPTSDSSRSDSSKADISRKISP